MHTTVFVEYGTVIRIFGFIAVCARHRIFRLWIRHSASKGVMWYFQSRLVSNQPCIFELCGSACWHFWVFSHILLQTLRFIVLNYFACVTAKYFLYLVFSDRIPGKRTTSCTNFTSRVNTSRKLCSLFCIVAVATTQLARIGAEDIGHSIASYITRYHMASIFAVVCLQKRFGMLEGNCSTLVGLVFLVWFRTRSLSWEKLAAFWDSNSVVPRCKLPNIRLWRLACVCLCLCVPVSLYTTSVCVNVLKLCLLFWRGKGFKFRQ